MISRWREGDAGRRGYNYQIEEDIEDIDQDHIHNEDQEQGIEHLVVKIMDVEDMVEQEGGRRVYQLVIESSQHKFEKGEEKKNIMV